MAKHTVTAYVYQVQYAWDKKPCYRVLSNPNQSDHEYSLVGPVEVEFEVPEGFDPRAERLAALEKQRAKLDAEIAKVAQ